MRKKNNTPQRREVALARDLIVKASIEILDSKGEFGLTFRVLADHLATGPGAIYWHVANKTELLGAACDFIIARTMERAPSAATPQANIRAIALNLFDEIDAHPWVGTVLTGEAGQLPLVRIIESIGQQVVALGVPQAKQWESVSVLFHYILGVSRQNATNAEIGRKQSKARSEFLSEIANNWLALDPQEYPFTRNLVPKLLSHDDRVDFLEGIDLILSGISLQTI